MNKPYIGEASIKFIQDGNTLGTTEEYESITIEAEYQLPSNSKDSEGPFFVLKTEGWSIDNVADIKELIDLFDKELKTISNGLQKDD